jgi:putative ABC transport system permease protein
MSMRASYISKLAIRNIWGHKLRSFLTILGITIGIGFIVVLISIGYGLQRISTSQIANLEALQIIDITPGKSKVVKISDETIDKFAHLSNVTNAAPEVNMVGNISYGTSTIEGVIYGKNSEYLKLEDQNLAAGKVYAGNQDNQVIVNQSMLSALNLKTANALGKEINLKIVVSPDSTKDTNGQPIVKTDKYVVVGVLSDQSSPFVYIPLEKFKAIGVVNYSAAKIRVKNQGSVALTQRQVENMGYKTTTLKQTVDQINQFFQIFQLILLSFGIIAVIVASIGMFNTLTISLLEKTKEISFMKVLGTNKSDIWKLFLAESIIIGVIGGVTGILGGMLIGSSVNNFLADLAKETGNKPVEIFYTPPFARLIIIGATILVSFVTGIYPSARASRIDPLESMRYE